MPKIFATFIPAFAAVTIILYIILENNSALKENTGLRKKLFIVGITLLSIGVLLFLFLVLR